MWSWCRQDHRAATGTAAIRSVRRYQPVDGVPQQIDMRGVHLRRVHLRTTRIDPGAEHIDSPHDVDVRWSSKRSTQWSGYEVHLSETCEEDLPHLIVAVHTTQATESDIPALADVHTRLAANHATPGEHHLDEGYVTAEAIATAQTDEIEIVGPLTRDSSWQAKQNNGYDESAFTLDWDAQVATCPQGRTSCSWTRRAHMAGDGAAIRFRHQVLPSLPRTPLMHPLGVRRTPDRPRLPGTARDPGPKPRSAGRPGLEPPLRPTFRHRRRHLRSRTRLRPAPHPVPRHGQNRRRTRPDRLRHQRRTHRRLDRTQRPTRPTTQPVPADQALLNHPGHSELANRIRAGALRGHPIPLSPTCRRSCRSRSCRSVRPPEERVRVSTPGGCGGCRCWRGRPAGRRRPGGR
jgi:hypothetical protein